MKDLYTLQEGLVKAVGEFIGYGRTMQLCEQLWREAALSNGTQGSEHTVGPCSDFMVKCPHTIKDDNGHCDICCGSGRITKGVAELLNKIT